MQMRLIYVAGHSRLSYHCVDRIVTRFAKCIGQSVGFTCFQNPKVSSIVRATHIHQDYEADEAGHP